MSPISMVLVPAASVLPVHYQVIVEKMKERDLELTPLHIPSVGEAAGAGRAGKPPTMYDDAAFIASHVTGLANSGKDVLLVTHSYGGAPATESVKGLSKTERQKMGKPGGVVGLAYITSLVPEIGKPASVMVGPAAPPSSKPPLMQIGDDGWLFYPDIPRVAEISFSDLSQEEGEHLARQLAKHSAAGFGNPLTYAGYKDVPVSYLVCENDLAIRVEAQRAQIEMIERESGNKVDVTSIQAGHSVTLSSPDVVVEWLAGVAKKLIKA